MGSAATTAAERSEYAAELIQACRERGLGAIAITDHHDFAFFPYVRQAAAVEVDATGNPMPPDQRIVVFPGVELTLSSPPCQALLLMSADFDEAKLPDILTTLTIAATPETESKLASVEQVSPTAVTGLNDLEARLNQQKFMRGRFIILPNVTEGGHKTLFRDGFAPHYKEMHCVGGYVDGDYEERTSVGKRNILEGRQQNNGYQPIAVLQTSDNRKRDHSTLGKHITWIKWAEPTAEALRQACLAKESRLSLTEPKLPAVWITSITVSNSKFLGRIDLDLNQQYNAIIGGRGTGKSTILEYLRWGLCDEVLPSEDIDTVQGKRRSLIENTLHAFDGDVHVTFIVNDVPHIVKRSSKKKEILLKIGTGAFVIATEDQVRSLLPIQAYSQKQLSSVSVRVEELRRFVELPIKDALDSLASDARDLQAKARTAYGHLTRKRELDSEIEKHDLEIQSLLQQADTLRKGLKGLSPVDQLTIEQKPLYDSEEALIDGFKSRLAVIQRVVADMLRDLPKGDAPSDETPILNTDLINAVRVRFTEKLAAVEAAANTLHALVAEDNLGEFAAAVSAWNEAKAAFDVKYDTAKGAAKVNEQQLDQIKLAENRVAGLRKAQGDRRNAIAALGAPDIAYQQLRVKWDALHEERRQALQAQCDQFTILSNGLIKADIGGSLDAASLSQRLKSTFAGMNIKEDKVDKICSLIVADVNPIAGWNIVLDELERLALHKGDTSNPVPDTPRLSKAGLIDSERQRIAGQLTPSKWIDLSLATLEFNPVFSYCTNREKAEYIDFADASAGQQATALLSVLLNQPGAPLVIDQPEDDIDSRMIGEIVEQLWKSKKKRQLIFASHSANFVVNGDAELVVCCDYVKAGDQTQGAIKTAGAIDIKAVREEITLVTEGGEQAFRLRKAKYGF